MAAHILLVATKNQGKVAEICQLLTSLTWTIINLGEFPTLQEPAEVGSSFAENALIKGHYYHTKTGLLTLSDDSGLEVDALNGAPGIYSARYAGEQADDRIRCEKLLTALTGIPDEHRTARFTCAIAIVGKQTEQVFISSVEGRILHSPRGQGGFGYDPIFEYPPLSKTFAELTNNEKAMVSHRGRALAQVCDFFSHWP
ncbi:MAG: RdgB/HAM1 family non-canonical purine NTP pyrophosphatase [Acidobacteriota bacterium]